ncbi:hypothetical protein [Actinomycetospora sp. NBRC 106375]|uniref:hypothetical protein n=1 Tax=Actinomycetospora sp. NBRC 106375 TaxID=3032207 RepID=UPI002553DD51|nr:hypothetical protein [Actinomycetospora sp. NBRC 106375]
MPRRPRRPGPTPSEIAGLAPLRVAAVADLVAAGLSSATVARRVRRGLWQRLVRGTVLLQSGAPSRDQLVRIALVHTRPDGVITGVEAARRHGLRRLPDSDEVHVLVDEHRRVTSSAFVVVERTERLPKPVVREEVPVAPLERAVTDTVRRCADRDEVRALIAEVIGDHRSTVARLRRELDAGSQRGTGLAREVLVEIEDGIRSASEGWARDVHAASDLPPVLWNPKLLRADGRPLGRPDAWFDDVGLAWEIDSLEFHPEGDDATARRRAAFVAAGVVVVHHRPGLLRSDPARVIAEVWSSYLLAASRPRPSVSVVPVSQAG